MMPLSGKGESDLNQGLLLDDPGFDLWMNP